MTAVCRACMVREEEVDHYTICFKFDRCERAERKRRKSVVLGVCGAVVGQTGPRFPGPGEVITSITRRPSQVCEKRPDNGTRTRRWFRSVYHIVGGTNKKKKSLKSYVTFVKSSRHVFFPI